MSMEVQSPKHDNSFHENKAPIDQKHHRLDESISLSFFYDSAHSKQAHNSDETEASSTASSFVLDKVQDGTIFSQSFLNDSCSSLILDHFKNVCGVDASQKIPSVDETSIIDQRDKTTIKSSSKENDRRLPVDEIYAKRLKFALIDLAERIECLKGMGEDTEVCREVEKIKKRNQKETEQKENLTDLKSEHGDSNGISNQVDFQKKENESLQENQNTKELAEITAENRNPQLEELTDSTITVAKVTPGELLPSQTSQTSQNECCNENAVEELGHKPEEISDLKNNYIEAKTPGPAQIQLEPTELNIPDSNQGSDLKESEKTNDGNLEGQEGSEAIENSKETDIKVNPEVEASIEPCKDNKKVTPGELLPSQNGYCNENTVEEFEHKPEEILDLKNNHVEELEGTKTPGPTPMELKITELNVPNSNPGSDLKESKSTNDGNLEGQEASKAVENTKEIDVNMNSNAEASIEPCKGNDINVKPSLTIQNIESLKARFRISALKTLLDYLEHRNHFVELYQGIKQDINKINSKRKRRLENAKKSKASANIPEVKKEPQQTIEKVLESVITPFCKFINIKFSDMIIGPMPSDSFFYSIKKIEKKNIFQKVKFQFQ